MHLDRRVPEPELMDDRAQAAAYAAADFADAHNGIVAEMLARFPELASAHQLAAVDLGCGSGDLLARVAVAVPGAHIVGIDGSPAMLSLAPARLAADAVAHRVHLEHRVLPDPDLGRRRFGLVVSNSLLHHLHDPFVLWATVVAVAAPGAAVFVADLCRPVDDHAVDELVERYAADEPEILRRDFRASLRAAWRPQEVREQLVAAGLGELSVDQISDRHLAVSGRWGSGSPGDDRASGAQVGPSASTTS